MRVLFLDDMPARHTLAAEIAAKYDIVIEHAYTAAQAISMLERSNYDAASLDHDLADEHYAGQMNERTGMAVARWIKQNKKPTNVLVHSFNPDGSAAMVLEMMATIRVVVCGPFGPESFTRWIKSLVQPHL